MASPPTPNITNTAQEAAAVVAQIRDDAATRLRTAFPYLKTEALDNILNHIFAAESMITAQDTAMTASKANKCFTDLPPELRTRIYEMALISDDKIEIQTLRLMEYDDTIMVQADARAALLSVNRQVRSETLPVYYGNNTFKATFGRGWDISCTGASKVVVDWAKMIGQEQAGMLSKLNIEFPGDCHEGLIYQLPYYSTGMLTAAKRGHPVELLSRDDILRVLGLEALGIKREAIGVFYGIDAAGIWFE